MRMDKLIFIDLETGTIDPQKGSLLSLAACVYDLRSDTVHPDVFNEYVKWDKYTVQAESLRVNRLNPVDVFDKGLTPDIFCESFFSWVAQHLGKMEVFTLAGHNTHFDYGHLMFLLNHTLATTESPRLSDLIATNKAYINYRLIDTYVLGQFLVLQGKLPEDTPLNLKGLCKTVGIELTKEDAHTALGDTLATVKLFSSLRKL